MRVFGGLGKLALGTVLAGVLVAALMLPYAIAVGLASNQVTEAIENAPVEGFDDPPPERSVMVDVDGKVIASFYEQDRVVVDLEEISPLLQWAVVSTEDRRFMTHPGVDWRGTIRGLLKTGSGEAQQGGSTLTQQLVKNQRYLVLARTEQEKADAIAVSYLRKLQEAKVALVLSQPGALSKSEVLERYLNLVAFGPSVYGAQASAQYFFGVDAKDLTLPQAALMAGMVKNPNTYNPFNPDRAQDALERRNIVLDLMAQNRYITQAEADAAKKTGLDMNRHRTSNNCVSAPNSSTNGYFCTYVLDYLQNTQGLSMDEIRRGGYTIQTTLDPEAMKAAKDAVDAQADPGNPDYERVANVTAVLQPGVSSRKVLALAANRPYGLDKAQGQTVQRLTTTFAPLGAGSTFKIFTAAAAMEKGLGTMSMIDTPAEYRSPLAPAHTFRNYPGVKYASEMTLENALATSPNTSFVSLEDQVGLEEVVRISIALGLRGYELDAGSVDRAFAGSGRDFRDEISAQKMASYTLGVTPVSPVELANVGATLASSGLWCPPTPIDTIRDRNGEIVPNVQADCEQAVEPALARTLTDALQADHEDGGTAAPAAKAAEWTQEMASKTGTTNDYKSSAFLGYTPYFSAAVMTWDYLDRPQSICVDADGKLAGTCQVETASGATIEGEGSLGVKGMTGGTVPAATWFSAMTALQAGDEYDGVFDPADSLYITGVEATKIPTDLIGQQFSDASAQLTAAGFTVNTPIVTSDCSFQANQVMAVDPKSNALPGSTVTLTICDGSAAGG